MPPGQGASAARCRLRPGLPASLALAPLLALAQIPLAVAQPLSAPSFTTPEAAGYWRHSATEDVAAAYRLLKENHPGAAAEMGDLAFRKSLQQAHATASARARRVVSLQGYVATMAGFADSFGDKHLRSIPFLEIARPDWAGVILGKRGTHWMVVDTEDGSPEATLRDAELQSCDGRSPESWGADILGHFRADWSVDAQKVQTAPWLLISEGNPFVSRPSRCLFLKDGVAQGRELNWRPIARAKLDLRLPKAITFGAAGFGIRRVGGGYWIAVQQFLENAEPVVQQVRAQGSEIRAAPFVVLDVRGNGGGSSIFGDQIAREVFGPGPVEMLDDPAADACNADVFRASLGNAQTLQSYLDRGFPSRSAEVVANIRQSLESIQSARAAGKAFAGSIACTTTHKDAVASSSKTAVFVLTDGLCFSACLALVDTWLRLGAVQIGQPTDANTRYTDVHDVMMPSGLSTFSTMMAVNPGGAPRLGPFQPSIPYDGDISDTAALERWVVDLTQHRARS